MITSMTTTVPTATLAIALMTSSAGTAFAVTERVRDACREDYLAYCSDHDPAGTTVRRCMNVHGARLSKECVEALVADGEVSRAEVQRRKREAADR